MKTPPSLHTPPWVRVSHPSFALRLARSVGVWYLLCYLCALPKVYAYGS